MNENSPSTSTASAETPPPPSSGARRKWLVIGLVAAVAVAAPVVLYSTNVFSRGTPAGGDLDAQGIAIATVERGPMTATITESGELVAEKSQTVKNDLRWPGEIEEIAEEGTFVEAGQLLIRFKCEELTDAIEEAQLRVRQADDAHKAAVTTDDLLKTQMKTKVRKAEFAVDDAKSDLKRYEEAEWPQKREDSKADIMLAERDLKLARHKLNSRLKINADPELNKPYSKNEIEAEQLSVDRLELALGRVEMQAKILNEYTHPRSLRDLKNGVIDVDLLLVAANAEREKQLKLSTSGVELAAHKLKKEREQIEDLLEDREERMVVKAKEPGLVVYETRRRPWHRPITVAVGEILKPGQQLMIIPDINTLVFKTQVYEAVQETVRDKVAGGLPTVIRLDARRTQSFKGKVSKVASLPDSQNPWLSPGVKVYPTTVTLNGDVTQLSLKPGMTGDAEITLDEMNDVLSVPIAAVFSDQEEAFCYRVGSAGKAIRVTIKIGLTSSSRVQVIEGVAEGDRVLLAPPPGASLHTKKEEKKKPEDIRMPGENSNGNGAPAAKKPAPTTQPAGVKPPAGDRPAGGRPSGGGTRRGGGGGGGSGRRGARG